jgi:nitrite reductase/ring-hydroxylating ferredoxin subunit
MDHTTTTEPIERAEVVAHLDDIAEGTLRMVRVGDHRVCLVRTGEGVFALDNRCPHEGYGLTQGNLDGNTLTCAWHNWKFRVSDGTCLMGDEGVPTHHVHVDANGAIRVELDVPDPSELRSRLLPSLREGIAEDRTGQIARDVVRLLRAGADPAQLVWEAVAHGAPRAQYGWGHPVAVAADLLAMVDLYEGDQRALPVVQAIAHIAHAERHRRVNPLPTATAPPVEGADLEFRRLVESEHVEAAQSMVLGALDRGADAAELRHWFTGVVSDHHLSYGHAAIYTQKAFQLLDRIGWDHAPTVLAYLVPSIVNGTREDTLPYSRPFVKGLAGVELEDLAAVDPDPSWRDDGRLRDALLGPDRRAPAAAAVEALRAGAGVHGLLDVVVEVISIRMLRYDTDGERDFHDDFGWLDITHGLTYANAVRWLADRSPGQLSARTDIVRLSLWCVFQAHWTGRHEWHTGVGPMHEVEPLDTDLVRYGQALQRESLLDGSTAPIVHAHAVKMSVAATEEAVRTGSRAPLDATARFLTAPKLERFVAATVVRSIDFLSGRGPAADE